MPLASGRAARKGFHWKAGGQDNRDLQDTQDMAGVWREALPTHWQFAGAKRFQCAVLGVLEVLGVLTKAPVSRSSPRLPSPRPARRQPSARALPALGPRLPDPRPEPFTLLPQLSTWSRWKKKARAVKMAKAPRA